MVLHTVNKKGEALLRCLSLLADADALLLIEDGVYAAQDTSGNVALWQQHAGTMRCFVLESDVAARGITDNLLPHFDVVTWQQFVALTLEYDKVVSWG
jgi:tRNA 2-thiouridine synthesizing protein B